jgi:hypothetical protein
MKIATGKNINVSAFIPQLSQGDFPPIELKLLYMKLF